MRSICLALFASLSLLVPAFSQETPTRLRKVLTPEQQKYQQQYGEVAAHRQELTDQANQIFATEMAREKAGDCRDADNTAAGNICYGKAADITGQNLLAYENAIKGILGLHYPTFPGRPPVPGVSEPTPEQDVAEFERTEQLWHAYLKSASTQGFHQMGGGTGGPSFEMAMQLFLTRNHMREIDSIYNLMLHH